MAATLTATDTVSVLNIIKERDFPRLHSIIFGEGIINDAVALLLFKTIKVMIKVPRLSNLFQKGEDQSFFSF